MPELVVLKNFSIGSFRAFSGKYSVVTEQGTRHAATRRHKAHRAHASRSTRCLMSCRSTILRIMCAKRKNTWWNGVLRTVSHAGHTLTLSSPQTGWVRERPSTYDRCYSPPPYQVSPEHLLPASWHPPSAPQEAVAMRVWRIHLDHSR